MAVASGFGALSARAATTPAPAANVSTASFADFQKNVQPFLAGHCYECHGEKDSEGDVRFDILTDQAALTKNIGTVEKALKMLASRKMPPKTEPRPTEEEYGAALAWMNAFTDNYYLTGPLNPGRVTIHRLNRVEYDNTIRDLLAIDLHPADSFPADDAGNGFDNNGDALTIAPVLFEKYIKAAEVSMNKAVFSDPVVAPPYQEWPAATADGDIPKPDAPAAAANGRPGRGENARIFQHYGNVYADYNFPADGDYIFSLKGYPSGGVAGRGGAGATADVLFYVDTTPVGGPLSDGQRPPPADQGPNPLKVTGKPGASSEPASVKFHVTAGQHRIYLSFRNGATVEEYDKAVADAAAAAAAAAASPPAVSATEAAPAPDATAAPTVAAIVPTVSTEAAVPAAAPAIAANAGGSDPAVTGTIAADPAAAAPPAGARGQGNFGRGGAGRGAGAGRRGGGPSGPASVTGQVILALLSFKAEGPEFTNAVEMPERMPQSYRQVMTAHPSATLSRDAAAEKIIRDFTTRAYRRPVTDEEVQGFMKLWASVDNPDRPFEKSVSVVLQAVLLNSNFLFRVENDPLPGEKDNIHVLNDYELASRLSYFLWSSMPDQELFDLAAKGQLHANLDAQVTRMLKDPKAQALVENFAGQWLHLRKVEDVSPDAEHYPNFSPSLKSDMLKETQMFFSSIKDEDRSVIDFINGNYTFVNEPLAKLYGLDGVTGEEFRKVNFAADSPRGGLLTQPSVLALTSYSVRTSPVQRGKWVLENLLDDAPPPPPPNVPALDDQHQLTGTLRQQMEQHRANPACASCHERMDAIGFSLENFDVIGAWRPKYANDDAIDPTGKLPDGTTFSGARELEQKLLDSKDQFCRCLAGKMLSYALGRNVEPYDKRTVNKIVSTMAQQDNKFSALIKAIVHSEAFQERRGYTGDNT